jgi:hypothetical protein
MNYLGPPPPPLVRNNGCRIKLDILCVHQRNDLRLRTFCIIAETLLLNSAYLQVPYFRTTFQCFVRLGTTTTRVYHRVCDVNKRLTSAVCD